MTALTLKSTRESAGKVSEGNTKMPGSTFATDAFSCRVGSKLAKVKGSVCAGCYARRLQKLRPSVNKGWSRNQNVAVKLIATDPAAWVEAMAFQIDRLSIKSGEPFHRWFDSGDLDSVAMLRAICEVARKTPHVKHWLPTREAGIVADYRKQGGSIPRNLRVRLSSTMIGDKPRRDMAKRLGVSTSTVHREGDRAHGWTCPASQQGKACGACRHCWESPVNVSYPYH